MRLFAAHEDADVFPHEPWVYLHVMDVQTDVAVPAQFGKENHIFHFFCHAFQTTSERVIYLHVIDFL